MDTSVHISLSTWLFLLYVAIGLTLAMLQEENIYDSGKRILRSWGIMFLWLIYVPIISYRKTTKNA